MSTAGAVGTGGAPEGGPGRDGGPGREGNGEREGSRRREGGPGHHGGGGRERDEPILVADSIGRSFGSTEVLKSATLWARAGEITVLLGRNGSGKTTLLRVAAGWLAPHRGVVRWDGRVVPRARLHRLARRGLFYLPQESLLPRGRTVRDAAVAVARAFPGPPGEADLGGRIAGWAERWDLTHLLDATSHALSGGEKNRIGAALAVLRGPACLLTDEPLTGSSPRDRARIAEALRVLRDRGCAVVVTGHEARELFELADRVVWLVAGTSRDLGPTARALESHQFRREYLGRAFEAARGAGGTPGPRLGPTEPGAAAATGWSAEAR